MTEDAQHVFFFRSKGPPSKYTPEYDKTRSIPSRSYGDVNYGLGRPVNMAGKRLVFTVPDVKTEKDEARLRSYDLICSDPGDFLFVNERLFAALEHLVDKDIQVLPAELDTPNGPVEGYRLIEIYNVVDGIDKERSWYSWQSLKGKFVEGPLSEMATYGCRDETSISLYKFIPKNENFMEGHELALEKEFKSYIYVTSSLRQKLLKGKFKGLWMPSSKEYWERLYNAKLLPY